MIKHSTLALIMASGSLIALPALAVPAPQATSSNSIYISGDVGYGALATPDKYLAEPDGIVITETSRRNGSVAGGAGLGFNHAFTPHILAGAEFGYDYNGQAKYTETAVNDATLTLKINSQDLHLLATGAYLFPNGFNIFGKAGAAYVNQKLKIIGDSTDAYDNTTIDGYKPMVAAGVGYQFKMVNIYAQYSHIFGSDPQNFSDLFNTDGTFSEIVSVDTFKLGAAVNVRI